MSENRSEHISSLPEEIFRTLFISSNQGLCLLRKVDRWNGGKSDFVYVIANPAFAMHTGASDAVGRTVLEVMPSLEPQIPVLDRVLQSGVAEHFEAGGVERGCWLEGEAIPTAIPGTIALVLTNVTERKRIELSLRESEERYRNLFETMRQGYLENELIRDADGHAIDYRTLTVNSQFERLTGISAAEAVGRTARELVGKLDPVWIETYDRVVRNGEPERFEREEPAFGRWFEVHAYPLTGDRFAILYDDITERRRAEIALRESEKQHRAELAQQVQERTMELQRSRDLLQATMDSSEDMIQVFEAVRDEHGSIIDFNWVLNNHTSETKYGEVRGESLLERNPGVVQEGIFDTFKHVAETGIPIAAERHYVHEQFDGWFYQSAVKLGDGVATTTKDITAWKQSQEEVLRLRDEVAHALLRESEQNLYGVANIVPDLLWYSEPDGSTPWYNDRWLEYTGQSLEQATGRGWVDAIHPDDREGSARRYRDAVAQSKSLQQEHRIRSHTGEYRWFLVRSEPLRDDHGRVTRMYGAATDIQDQRQALELLRESEERQAFLLRFSDVLRSLQDPREIQQTASTLLGEHFRVNRALYAEIEGEGDSAEASINGQYVNGVAPVPARVNYRSLTRGFPSEAWRRGLPVVVEDSESDPRFEPSLREAWRTIDTRASLAIPLTKAGKEVVVFGFHNATPRRWKQNDLALLTDAVERTWAAAERAIAETALRKSEERQAFLLRLSDALRPLSGQTQIQQIAATMTGEYFQASRVGFAEIVGDELILKCDYTDGVRSIVGRYHKDGFGAGISSLYFESGVRLTNDVANDPQWSPEDKQRLLSFNVAAFLGSTRHRENGLSGGFAIHQSTPRVWTQAEIVLVTEISDRVWDAVERARAEAALRESEERFQQFANASSDLLWMRDATTLDMEYLSSVFESIYGTSPNDVVGDIEKWAALIVPDDRDQVLANVVKVRSGEQVTHEFRIRRPDDGIFRWIRNTDFPLLDANGKVTRIAGIGSDITDEKLSTEHQAILLAELQHRVRNIMAMIRSVARRTERSATSVHEYAALISGRVMSLARTQSLLTRAANADVEITEVVHAELEALAEDVSHYRISGPQLKISPKAAEVLSLAIHELATNALKYGALAVTDGLVLLQWRVTEENGRQWLKLSWSETRTPAANWVPPSRRGFGTELVERRVPYELHGRGNLQVTAQGAQVSIEFPLSSGTSILETGAPMRKSVFGGSIDMTGEPSLEGSLILVLEDDYLLASDAESALIGVGAVVLGPFSLEAEAIEAARQNNLSAAVIDINLGQGPSFQTAYTLRQAGVPFVFVTGYDDSSIPPEFADVSRFVKPIDFRQLVRGLAKSLNKHDDRLAKN